MTKKHLLIMVLCCLAPLAGYAALALLGVPSNSILLLGMVLLCPILHLLVMQSIWKHASDDQRPGAGGRLHRGEGQGPIDVERGTEPE